MKKIFLFLIGVLVITSCSKEPIGNYKTLPPEKDSTNQNPYINGGAVPNNNWQSPTTQNQICGTIWVLIDVYIGYAHTDRKDTINFITNTNYRLGSDTTNYTYSIYETMGNSTLDFYQFNPINGLYLSSNSFNAKAFKTTPINGEIILQLKDKFNTKDNYIATFKKLK